MSDPASEPTEFQQLVKLAIRETSFCFSDFDSPIPYAARCPPYAPQCAEMYCCDNNLALVAGKLTRSSYLATVLSLHENDTSNLNV